MKRFIERLSDNFTNWPGKEARIGHVIGAVLAIITAVCLFLMTDTTPATASDYEAMEKQVIAIQQNHDLLFETDCNININDDVITVNFENDECKLTAQYNKNFDLLSTSKEDKSEPRLYTLFWVIIMAIEISILAAVLLTIFIVLCECLYEYIHKRYKLSKTNQPKS